MEKKITDDSSDAKISRCEKCHKNFTTNSDVDYHKKVTGHDKFVEICEKEEISADFYDDVVKKDREFYEEKKEKATLEEKKQKEAIVKEDIKKAELRKLAVSRKSKNLDEKEEVNRILKKFQSDREEVKLRFFEVPPAKTVPVLSAHNDNCCRIKFRLPNGDCLTTTFGVEDKLKTVLSFLQKNRTDGHGPYTLSSEYPKRDYTENDLESSLSSLGLCPSAVLIVCNPQQ